MQHRLHLTRVWAVQPEVREQHDHAECSYTVVPAHSASSRAFTPVFDGLWMRVNALMLGTHIPETVIMGPRNGVPATHSASQTRVNAFLLSRGAPREDPSRIRWVRFAKMRRASSPLMLRSIAARCARLLPGIVALRCVSKHEGACAGSSSSFETRARAFEVCRTPSACALLRMRPSRRAHARSKFAERFRRARSSG